MLTYRGDSRFCSLAKHSFSSASASINLNVRWQFLSWLGLFKEEPAIHGGHEEKMKSILLKDE